MLVVLTSLVIQESNKAVRDTQRREEIIKFTNAAESFKDDYGFYPNYSMILGVGKDKAKELNYDLESTISRCADYGQWAVKSDLVTPEKNLNNAYLKPGYFSVGRFLICLRYLESLSADPLWAGTVSDYQYRVSNDHQKIVVQAKTERSGLVTLGSGLSDRNLRDDSDSTVVGDNGFYQSFVGRDAENGKYLYQCLVSSEKKKLTVKERSDKKYAPYILGEDLSWVPNPACRDTLDSLQVVASH